jgi:glycosyltransferase involved in cell wall biosynthesis
MKVLIVDTVSFERAPYLKYYIEACNEQNVAYDLFLWNRQNNGELTQNQHIFTFHRRCDFGGGKIKKILPMMAYRKALLKQIRDGNYTHLILINTLASVMISSTVFRKFTGKYIMDIRDYTYEGIGFYRKLVNQLVKNSTFTTLSSRGFLAFIDPNSKIIINHNISNIESIEKSATLGTRKPITIGFVGSVRYKSENMLLINALRNNPNYELLYVGSMVSGCNLEECCNQENIMNVEFQGRFDNNNKPDIYKSIDIINAIYGTFSLEVTTAIPNRLYDALLFKKPIIASKGTFLGDVVEKNKLGIAVELNSQSIKEKVNNYVKSFDENTFVQNCNECLKKVIGEQNFFKGKIRKFLTDNQKE